MDRRPLKDYYLVLTSDPDEKGGRPFLQAVTVVVGSVVDHTVEPSPVHPGLRSEIYFSLES